MHSSLRAALAAVTVALVAPLALSCTDKQDSATTVPGVTDTEILLGTHFPLSQHLAAAYAPIATAGMQGYFDYINDQGGINGRKIKLLIEDDHYTPSDTAQVVRQLVEHDQVFAIIGGLGTATHSAVSGYLEEQGVPDMFILSGAAKFTDPVVKSRFGGNPDYITEGKILGSYVAREHPNAKLGLILQNDDFGEDGKRGIEEGIAGSGVTIAATEMYESTETDLTSHVQRVRNAGADVVMVYALPPQGANVVKVAREVLNWDAPIVVTGVDATDIFIDLAGAKNAECVVSVVFGKQVYQTDDPGIAKHIEIVNKYGGGVPPSNLTVSGQAIAEFMVEALKKAGRNLTRQSLLDAAESIRDFTCSVCLVPASLSPTDHRPFEVEEFVSVADGKWVTFGSPVGFESTPSTEGGSP
jgi:ABC-type branched-subunit amino acid transport system substrate-binding protein